MTSTFVACLPALAIASHQLSIVFYRWRLPHWQEQQ